MSLKYTKALYIGLIETLGITQEDYERLEELQLVVFGIKLECRK